MYRVPTVAKAIVAGIIAIAQVIYAAISAHGGTITNTELVSVGLAILTVLGVYVVPNSPYPPEPPARR